MGLFTENPRTAGRVRTRRFVGVCIGRPRRVVYPKTRKRENDFRVHNTLVRDGRLKPRFLLTASSVFRPAVFETLFVPSVVNAAIVSQKTKDAAAVTSFAHAKGYDNNPS